MNNMLHRNANTLTKTLLVVIIVKNAYQVLIYPLIAKKSKISSNFQPQTSGLKPLYLPWADEKYPTLLFSYFQCARLWYSLISS